MDELKGHMVGRMAEYMRARVKEMLMEVDISCPQIVAR